MNSASKFSDLPNELKLHIFSYLDFNSLRHACPFVSKEFNTFSSDPSLFKHYKLANLKSCNYSRAMLELRDKIYQEHLKELIVPAFFLSLVDIEDLRFNSLQKLIIRVSVNDIERLADLKFETGSNYNIELQGTVNLDRISKRLLRSITYADVVCVRRKKDIPRMSKIPAHLFILNIRRMKLSVTDTEELLKEERMQKVLKHSEVKILVCNYRSVGPDVSWLQGRLSDLLKDHLVTFIWAFEGWSKDTWTFIVNICEMCTGMEEFSLHNLIMDERAPAIKSLATKRLHKVELSYVDCCNDVGKTMQYFILLLNNVQSSIYLQGACINSVGSLQLKTQCIYLDHCEFPLELLTNLPKCSASIDNCSIHYNNLETTGSSRLKSLKLILDSLSLMKRVLSNLDSLQRLSLSLDEFSEKEWQSRLSNINLSSIPDLELIFSVHGSLNSTLQKVYRMAPQVSVLDCQLYWGSTPLSIYTLRLLRRFKKLKAFHVTCTSDIYEDDVRQVFPTATIDLSMSGGNVFFNLSLFL